MSNGTPETMDKTGEKARAAKPLIFYRMPWQGRAWILALLFFLLYVPLLPNVSLWRGDERYYTDAVIQMVQTGDYLTPRFFDGTERFRKPGLVYWIMAANYKIFGISYLTTRLPFLIAGMLVIILTFQVSRILFRDAEAALVSAAIMASNPSLFHLSVRSTPDIILCFFIMVSLYGFLQLIFEQSRQIRHYAMAYLGAGLAVATKGMLGFFPVLFAFGYAFFRRQKGPRPRQLIHGPLMAGGLAIALAWFVLILFEHGAHAMTLFFNDQVANRIVGGKWYILDNLVTYPVSILYQFLPWTLLVVAAVIFDRHLWPGFRFTHKEPLVFILGWFVLLAVMFVSANIQRTRYFLPALPFLACFQGMYLVESWRWGRTQKFFSVMDKLLSLVAFFGGVLLVWAGRYLPLVALGGLTLIGYALIRLRENRSPQRLPALLGIALVVMLTFSVMDNLIRPNFRVSPAETMASRLKELSAGRSDVASIGVNTNYVTQVRVVSGGQIYPDFLQAHTLKTDAPRYRYILCGQSAATQLEDWGYRIEPCGYSYKRWRYRDIRELLGGNDPQSVYERMRIPHYLAIKE